MSETDHACCLRPRWSWDALWSMRASCCCAAEASSHARFVGAWQKRALPWGKACCGAEACFECVLFNEPLQMRFFLHAHMTAGHPGIIAPSQL